MRKQYREPRGHLYYHYPAVVVLVSAQAAGEENVMPVAWSSTLSYEPPLYGVAIAPERYTYRLIVQSGEFGVNFVSSRYSEIVALTGGSSGGGASKFERFGIAKEPSRRIRAPLLRDAYAAYECLLVNHALYGDHEWFVGEIVAVHYRPDLFDEQGVLRFDQAQPPLYLGADCYLIDGKKQKISAGGGTLAEP